ncbi:hypothetical protein [Aquimarina litoralis]|uniref:hypothetical protein n=1 Tax=Aquimarina litoralis TaxID=584605 RepID=UPI001C57F296|nr:hypothetical protein [Aquimarina litoralis]
MKAAPAYLMLTFIFSTSLLFSQQNVSKNSKVPPKDFKLEVFQKNSKSEENKNTNSKTMNTKVFTNHSKLDRPKIILEVSENNENSVPRTTLDFF